MHKSRENVERREVFFGCLFTWRANSDEATTETTEEVGDLDTFMAFFPDVFSLMNPLLFLGIHTTEEEDEDDEGNDVQI